MSDLLKGTEEDFAKIVKGLEYNEKGQQLSLSGTPGLITTVLTMNTLMDACVEIVGWDKASQILYKHGFLLCSQFVKQLRSTWGVGGLDLLKRYLRYVNVRGWGLFELVSVNKETGEAVIRGYQLWGSAYSRKKGINKESDSYYAGAVAGMMKAAFDKDVTAVETKCFAKGSEYCEFTARPEP
jgi:hypothetical protein